MLDDSTIIAEQLDDRDQDDLDYERTGRVVIVIPRYDMLGTECEGAGCYE